MSRRRILVIANETVEGSALRELLRLRATRAEVLVVAPALNSRLRLWLSDEDPARRAAEARLGRCLDRLRAAGFRVRGRIGDSDPLRAIDDALRDFDADEIVIATHPSGRSHWLERDLIGRALRRFRRPIVHVVAKAPGQHDPAGNYGANTGPTADTAAGAPT